MVIAKGKVGGEGGGKQMRVGADATERDFAWSSKRTKPCAENVLLSGTFETCMVLQVNVSPINSIKK